MIIQELLEFFIALLTCSILCLDIIWDFFSVYEFSNPGVCYPDGSISADIHEERRGM